MGDVPTHPVQVRPYHRVGASGKAPQKVTLAAYEVYCHVYGPQEAMVTGGCRGGFSTGEIIAMLYARSFPKAEWSARLDEGLTGLDV